MLLMVVSYRMGVDHGRMGGYESTLWSGSLFGVSESSSENPDLSLFWRSWDLLKDRYVDADDLTNKKMMEGAIQGVFSATGDPYTTFLNKEDNKLLESDLAGSFDGIGAEVGMRDKIITIIAPLPDSPAEKAGLRAGDKILRINGEETLDLGLDEAVSKMRGPKGTEVTFTVFREGDEETREITVERDRIEVKSVTVEYIDDNIAHIKLVRFGEDTERDLKSIVSTILSNQVSGIVLDMRNNPGGFLDTAVDVSGYFLPQGSVVVKEEYGGGKEVVEKSTGKGDLVNIPLVVLIDEGSASASEILAGAIKDNRNDVTLVGKQTFGKGSVQELVPLPGGTSAKITVAKWFTPSGKGIDQEGISPDIEVERTQEDFDAGRDPQLERALERVKGNE